MENIYSRDNFNISYKRFSPKMKRRPGRPPAYTNEPAVNCFVCDEKITRQRVNLLHGSSNNKDGFPCQISQLLGDEFLIIVQEDDYLCKQCVSLFNSMDKFEKQLADVKERLLMYLTKKYNLNNNSTEGGFKSSKVDKTKVDEDCAKCDVIESDDDDEITKQLNDLYTGVDSKSRTLKCNVCGINIIDQNAFDKHLREHINTAVETEFSGNNDEENIVDNISYTSSSAVKLYKCSICSNIYLSKIKCFEHMKLSHTSCETPGETSDEMFDKLIKSKSNDKISDNVHFCNVCRLTFSCNKEYNSHKCNNTEKLSNNVLSMEKLKDNFVSKPVKNQMLESNDDMEMEPEEDKNVVNCGSSMGNGNKTDLSDHMIHEKIDSTDKMEVSELSNDNSQKNDKKNANNDTMVEDDYDDDIGAGDVMYSEDDSYSESNSADSDDEHDDIDEEPEKHICGNCGFKGDLITLKEHFLEERLQRDLVCSVCGQSFNSFCKLIKHSSGHDINSKPIECIYCPDRIKLPDLLSLNYHMKKAHLQFIAEEKCELCDQMLPNLDYLERHRIDKYCLDEDVLKDMDVSSNPNNESDNLGNLVACENTSKRTNISVDKDLVHLAGENENAFINIDKHVNSFPENIDNQSHELLFSSDSGNENSVFKDCRTTFKLVNDSRDLMDAANLNEDPVSEALSVVYKCGICGEQRNNKTGLMMHFESHNTFDNNISNVQKIVCAICGIVFLDETSLKQHQIKHSETTRNIMCLYCKDNFHDYLHLKNHIMCSHSYNITHLFCSLCNFKFDSHILYRNHLITTHKNGNFFCKKCNKNFNFKYKLLRHYCTYHKNELKCKFCGMISDNLPNYIKHERFHLKNKSNLSCGICNRVFKNINSLKLHNIRHTCDLNLFCFICELSFNDVNSLNQHMFSHKSISDLYCCDKCGKKFMYYNLFRIHRLSHENEKLPYKCNSCHAKFNTLSLRAIHKRKLHKGKFVLFKCNFCNFSTNEVYIYKRHIFLHIKRYQYHCKLCFKSYSKQIRLTEHKHRIHNKFRMYKSFKSKFYKLDSNKPVISDNHDQTNLIVKSSDSALYCHLRKNESYVQ